jgi:hypothetical protein
VIFRPALKDFDSFLEALTEKISEVDETIPELPIKDIVSFQQLSSVEQAAYPGSDIPNIPRCSLLQ